MISTKTHINLNNICKKSLKKRLKAFGFYANKTIDYDALNANYPLWKPEIGCNHVHGDYSEEIIFSALKKAGFNHRQIWPIKNEELTKKQLKEGFFNELVQGNFQQSKKYGYLIYTDRPDTKHWICAVFIQGKLKYIDSRDGGVVEDFKMEKRFHRIYEIFPRIIFEMQELRLD